MIRPWLPLVLLLFCNVHATWHKTTSQAPDTVKIDSNGNATVRCAFSDEDPSFRIVYWFSGFNKVEAEYDYVKKDSFAVLLLSKEEVKSQINEMGKDGESEVAKLSSGLNSSLFIATLKSPVAGREYFCEFTNETNTSEVKFDVIGNSESLPTSTYKGVKLSDNMVIGSIIQGEGDEAIVPEFKFQFIEEWETYKATTYTLSTPESTIQIILHVSDVYYAGRSDRYFRKTDALKVTLEVAGSSTQYTWDATGIYGYEGQESDFLYVIFIYIGIIVVASVLIIAAVTIAAVRGKTSACCRS